MRKNSISLRETLPMTGIVIRAVRMSAGGAKVIDKREGKKHFDALGIHMLTVLHEHVNARR